MNFVNEELFGKDPRIVKAVMNAHTYAMDPHPVLINGEVGTGKQTLGLLMHQTSSRASAPCLIVDCARSELEVENDILGFRDESSGRFNKGVLERANGGTIIFKNIEGLHEEFQKKLHRILLDLPDYDIKVKIVVCTSKNLSKLVGAGRFQRALFIYISYHQISLVPLRERKDDLRFLIYKIVEKNSDKINVQVPRMAEDAMEKMLNFYWSHNLLELNSVIEETMMNLEGNEIALENLSLGEKKTSNSLFDIDEDGMKLMSLKEAERLLIRKALIHTSENRTQAAKILGVSIRTLRNKINEYRNDGSNFFVNLR